MNHPLHLQALELVRKYKQIEVTLIEVLTRIENEKLYVKMHYASMFQYCTRALGLSENSAYLWIGISRKCTEIPLLKLAIESGELLSSKARRILPILDKENSATWIQKAIDLPQKALEREVVKHNPSLSIPERIKPVCEGRSEFKVGISHDLEDLLNRCKEIVSNKKKALASWEDVLKALAQEYLKKKDPVQKAERVLSKPQELGARQVASSKARPALLNHQVFQRDRGQCQYLLPKKVRCLSRYFTEVHHKIPISEGGTHSLNNLTTLCWAHHQDIHDHEGREFKKRKVLCRPRALSEGEICQ